MVAGEKRRILAYRMSLRDKLLPVARRLMASLRAMPKTRIVSASAFGLALIAFGAAGVAPYAPDPSDLPVTMLTEEIGVPDLASQVEALRTARTGFVAEERVRAGDSLASLLERLGVSDREATAFIRSDADARALTSLRPGRRIQAVISADGKLLSASALLTDQASERRLVIERSASGFVARKEPALLERHVEMRSGEIRSSLFAATDAAQVPDPVAMQIVEIFSADIDFASDLRRGDRFEVIYESFWQGGEWVRSGRVLGASFRNEGKTHQAIWFADARDEHGEQGGYYDPEGKSLKKAFLKSPLQFSRVTSGFSMRVHPISGLWKQHKGIDFAAPTGTPIRATSDGLVDFAGSQGGYGNVVVLQHGRSYSTAYAHMSRIAPGLRRGTKVSQGDVIGYVGTSGWSTGPHLHYEFRVNDDARDPNSIVVPQVQTLTGNSFHRFRQQVAEMNHRFRLLSPEATQLASR